MQPASPILLPIILSLIVCSEGWGRSVIPETSTEKGGSQFTTRGGGGQQSLRQVDFPMPAWPDTIIILPIILLSLIPLPIILLPIPILSTVH